MPLVDFLRHLFLPHHTNNHRAKVLHVDALFTYVLAFALLNLGLRQVHQVMPQVLGYATDIHVEQLLAGTNAKRAEAGLSSLRLNGQLSAAAAGKAADMFAKNYWAHFSPTGGTPWEFISAAGYRYTIAGENLAKNFNTSAGVVDAWMASPTHRENLLKPGYQEVGFAIVNGVLQGEETTLVVQMFGATSAAPVAAAATPAPATPVPTVAAVATTPFPTSVVVTEEAVQVITPPVAAALPVEVPVQQSAGRALIQGITNKPLIDLSAFSRQIVFIFLGILAGVLLVDAWIVKKRHIVRVAGHNIGHLLFIGAIVLCASVISRGALL